MLFLPQGLYFSTLPIFYIVGSNPTTEVTSLQSDDIVVTGFVKDVSPYFDNCRVFVAPLRFGAGMKGKITQCMSLGLPLVTTTIGAEGIGLVNGINALIADDPREFAESVLKLYSDEQLWNSFSKSSIRHIRENYSVEVIRKKFMDILGFQNQVEIRSG